VTNGELCDDGNLVSGDGCDEDCTYPYCGNGIRASWEECDDGNRVDGDGCDSNCRPTGCGNFVVTSGEACDDGNVSANDGCEPDCRRSQDPLNGNPGGRPPGARPPGNAPACAASLALCDDRDACTVDSCRATGCAHEPIPGLDSVLCLLNDAAARSPGCTGQRVPKAVNRRLVVARRVLLRARNLPRSPAKRKLLRKAAHALRQAGTIAAFAWREEKVTVGCASEMLQVIGTAKGRFDALRGSRR
jgi:cysteine-rich repeat protein